MRQPERDVHPSHGFTLLELAIVLALVLIAALIGFPTLQRIILRTQLEGAAQEISMALRQGRLEAVRASAPAVVTLDASTRKVVVFVDLNKADGTPGSDLIFNPQAVPVVVPPIPKDYEVLQRPIPLRVKLGGPTADAATVKDFTPNVAGPRLVFNPDGSVLDTGGFRLGDGGENFLEIRVAPETTGRVQLQKWHKTDNTWYTRDMRGGKALWEWY